MTFSLRFGLLLFSYKTNLNGIRAYALKRSKQSNYTKTKSEGRKSYRRINKIQYDDDGGRKKVKRSCLTKFNAQTKKKKEANGKMQNHIYSHIERRTKRTTTKKFIKSQFCLHLIQVLLKFFFLRKMFLRQQLQFVCIILSIGYCIEPSSSVTSISALHSIACDFKLIPKSVIRSYLFCTVSFFISIYSI